MHELTTQLPVCREECREKKSREQERIRFFPGERKTFGRLVQSFFGEMPTKTMLFELFGATEHSELFLGTVQQKLYAEHYESKFLGLTGTGRVLRSKTGRLSRYQEIHIRRQTKQALGEGRRIFNRQIEICRKLGIRRILMFGHKTGLQRGYYVLPRFGFDAPLPEGILSELPVSLCDAQRIGELFRSEEGKNWWKKNGVGFPFPLVYEI